MTNDDWIIKRLTSFVCNYLIVKLKIVNTIPSKILRTNFLFYISSFWKIKLTNDDWIMKKYSASRCSMERTNRDCQLFFATCIVSAFLCHQKKTHKNRRKKRKKSGQDNWIVTKGRSRLIRPIQPRIKFVHWICLNQCFEMEWMQLNDHVPVVSRKYRNK